MLGKLLGKNRPKFPNCFFLVVALYCITFVMLIRNKKQCC